MREGGVGCKEFSVSVWQWGYRCSMNSVVPKCEEQIPKEHNVCRTALQFSSYQAVLAFFLIHVCDFCLNFRPQSRQSAKLFSSRRNWDSPNPTPHPQASVHLPPSLVPGGGAHSQAREGVGEFQFRRGDIHCGTLYIYVLCASDWTLPPRRVETGLSNVKNVWRNV